MTDVAFYLYPEVIFVGLMMMFFGAITALVVAPTYNSVLIALFGMSLVAVGAVMLSILIVYSVKHGR